jgi:hypothetical protein
VLAQQVLTDFSQKSLDLSFCCNHRAEYSIFTGNIYHIIKYIHMLFFFIVDWDVLSLWMFYSWDVLYSGNYAVGTFFRLGTFLRLGRSIFGMFYN